MFGEKGLKAIINVVLSTDMFKSLLKGLIMGRVAGLQEKYPQLYLTIDQYATAVSQIGEVVTDDDPNNVDQIAALFALEQNLKSVEIALKSLDTQSKGVRISLKNKE